MISTFSERRSHPLSEFIPVLSPRAQKNQIYSSHNINGNRVATDSLKAIPDKQSLNYSPNLVIQIPKMTNEGKPLDIFKRKEKRQYEPGHIIQQYLPSTPPYETNRTIQTSLQSLKKSTASTFYGTSSDCQSDIVKQTISSKLFNGGYKKLNTFNNFEVLKQIGAGKFSKVSVVRHKQTGFIAALKVLSKKNVTDETLITQLLREIKILSFVNHPNIVSLYGVCSDSENIYLIEEMGCHGELYSLLCKSKIFSQEAVSFVMKSLLSAVSYLHSHQILHRDIKPENVVIVHGIVKLCDLGWSVHTNSKFRQTICGTPLYSSPELLQGSKYNEKIDLWALGIMAYELRYGKAPFNIKNKSELSKIITDQIVFPEGTVSEQFQHFTRSLLHKNPKERLTAEMMLNHPFILKYKDFETCEELCIQKEN